MTTSEDPGKIDAHVPSDGADTTAWRPRIDRSTLLTGACVCTGYYLGAKLGFALTFQPNPVSVLWPPNSILLAGLLLTPIRAWWFVLLAALPAHLASQLQFGVPLKMMLCYYISNCCEALIGAGLTRYFLGGPVRFGRLRHVIVYCLCAAGLAPYLSSFVDAAFASWVGWGTASYWDIWRMRFSSNVVAALTIAPVILTWTQGGVAGWRRASFARRLEGALLFAALLVSCFFALYRSESGVYPALLFAPLPLLMWIAVRFGPCGTSTALFTLALFAIAGAVHDRGPFSGRTTEENALSIQLFLVAMNVPLMFLAAVVEERRKAEERFVKAFRSGPDAMAITRIKDGRIIEVNERWEKLFGYRREEAVGWTVWALNIYLSKADRDRLAAAVTEEQPLNDFELSLRTRSGELRQVVLSADAEDIARESCLILVYRDITDRKRAEEAQQNLAHASRLAVVGELTAMIAHEVNQPLGAILSNADAAEMLIGAQAPPLEEIRQILVDIRKNDLRASDVIRRIRTLLRKRDMEMQSLDLNETVDEVLRLVTGDALRRRIQIRKEFASKLPMIRGDRVYVQQMLLNLMLNAMDAMKDTPEDARRLGVRTIGNGEMAGIEVEDTGHGIPLEVLPRIFESFFTTKKDGMGLGLSIARSIVEAHGGNIRVENNPDRGVTFFIMLPLESAGTTACSPPGRLERAET